MTWNDDTGADLDFEMEHAKGQGAKKLGDVTYFKPDKSAKKVYAAYILPVPGKPGVVQIPKFTHALGGLSNKGDFCTCNRLTHSYVDQTGVRKSVPCGVCVAKRELVDRGGPWSNLISKVDAKDKNKQPFFAHTLWVVICSNEEEIAKGVQIWGVSKATWQRILDAHHRANLKKVGSLTAGFAVTFSYDPAQPTNPFSANFGMMTTRKKAGQDVKVAPGLAAAARRDEAWVEQLMADAPRPDRVVRVELLSDIISNLDLPEEAISDTVKDDFDKALRYLRAGTEAESSSEEPAIDTPVIEMEDDGAVEEVAEEAPAEEVVEMDAPVEEFVEMETPVEEIDSLDEVTPFEEEMPVEEDPVVRPPVKASTVPKMDVAKMTRALEDKLASERVKKTTGKPTRPTK